MSLERYQRVALIGIRTLAMLAAGAALGAIAEANRPGGTYHQQRIAVDCTRRLEDAKRERCCHD